MSCSIFSFYCISVSFFLPSSCQLFCSFLYFFWCLRWFSASISRCLASSNYCSMRFKFPVSYVYKTFSLSGRSFVRFTNCAKISVAAERQSCSGSPCSCSNLSRESISLYSEDVATSLTPREGLPFFARINTVDYQPSSSGSLRTTTW